VAEASGRAGRYPPGVDGGAPFQQSLFDADRPVAVDPSFGELRRIALDETSWIDLVPGWVGGADRLFAELVRERGWGQRRRWMYERRVDEPRLTDHWTLASGEPLRPAVVEEMRRALGARYGVVFDSAGFNWYRDGRDSVAWHGDRIVKAVAEPIVPLVVLGERRRFLLRPRAGGRSLVFTPGHGDLLVTGGTTQRTWLHAVPKVARAGPRISIAFRYGLDPRAYGAERAAGEER
jgi:alkylated DNA repair dioxygenase AlkB